MSIGARQLHGRQTPNDLVKRSLCGGMIELICAFFVTDAAALIDLSPSLLQRRCSSPFTGATSAQGAIAGGGNVLLVYSAFRRDAYEAQPECIRKSWKYVRQDDLEGADGRAFRGEIVEAAGTADEDARIP